ncbi:MAG: hypothetical protein ACREHE_14680 [Rhizomicrobium sp.]
MKGIKALAETGRPLSRLKNRGGAPRGNRNAWKHGSYTAGAIAERRAFLAGAEAWRARVRAFLARIVAAEMARRAANNAAVSD